MYRTPEVNTSPTKQAQGYVSSTFFPVKMGKLGSCLNSLGYWAQYKGAIAMFSCFPMLGTSQSTF